MPKLGRGASFLSKEIRNRFSSFYLFNDASTTKKDLIGGNNLTYGAGSQSSFHGYYGKGEKFDGTKYLENRSISPNVTGFPLFMFVCAQDEGDIVTDNEIISLSPWVSGFTNSYMIFRGGSSTNAVGAIMTDGGFASYSKSSKAIPSRIYSAALIMRSITDFTLFVNGERMIQLQTLASGFSTKNSIVIGAGSNGSSKYYGGIFSAGWGIVDPGDDFLRRLTLNPTGVIFQKSFLPMKSGAVIAKKIPWHLFFRRVI